MANNYSHFSAIIEDLTEEEKAWINSIPRGFMGDGEDTTAEDVRKFFGLEDGELEVHGIYELDHFPGFEEEVDSHWWLFAEEHFNSDHVLLVVQTFLRKFRPKDVFTMTWCDYCDKPRIGEFGGGWMCISAEESVVGNTWGAAESAADGLKVIAALGVPREFLSGEVEKGEVKMSKSYQAQQKQKLMASAWVDREHRKKWEYIEKRLGRAMTPDELKDYIGYINSKGQFRGPRKNWYAVPPGTEMKPRYKHICHRCEFITELTVKDTEYDVYRCAGPIDVTWIARYGNENEEYWSMPWDILKTTKDPGVSAKSPLRRAMFKVATRWGEHNG